MGRDGERKAPVAERAARVLVLAAPAAPLVYVPTLAFGWTVPGGVRARLVRTRTVVQDRGDR